MLCSLKGEKFMKNVYWSLKYETENGIFSRSTTTINNIF